MSDSNAIKRVGDTATGPSANCDVEIATRVVWESTTTDGDVGRAGSVRNERPNTVRYVVVAGGVFLKCDASRCRVVHTRGVT